MYIKNWEFGYLREKHPTLLTQAEPYMSPTEDSMGFELSENTAPRTLLDNVLVSLLAINNLDRKTFDIRY